MLQGAAGGLRALAQAYHSLLQKHRMATQAATTGCVHSLADIIAQRAVERRGSESHDWMRTARQGVFGLAVAGPALSVWYQVLQRAVTTQNPVSGLLQRVMLDQIVFAPLFVGAFFTTTSLLEGKGVNQTFERLQQGYLPALQTGWSFWPFVQLVNFSVVPQLYRVLVVNVVSCGWNAYLSHANARLRRIQEAVVIEGKA